jgi:hypothetical protein
MHRQPRNRLLVGRSLEWKSLVGVGKAIVVFVQKQDCSSVTALSVSYLRRKQQQCSKYESDKSGADISCIIGLSQCYSV